MSIAHTHSDSAQTTAMAAWSARSRPPSLDPMAKTLTAEEVDYRRRLGLVIVQLREIHGRMSAATLAEKLNRSEAALSRWENGKATPSAWDLRRLAEIFELTERQLELLVYPPEGPVSPVAQALAAAIEAGARTGRAAGVPPRAGRGAA